MLIDDCIVNNHLSAVTNEEQSACKNRFEVDNWAFGWDLAHKGFNL